MSNERKCWLYQICWTFIISLFFIHRTIGWVIDLFTWRDNANISEESSLLWFFSKLWVQNFREKVSKFASYIEHPSVLAPSLPWTPLEGGAWPRDLHYLALPASRSPCAPHSCRPTSYLHQIKTVQPNRQWHSDIMAYHANTINSLTTLHT